MVPIVEARGLIKRFGQVEALAGLDLVARSGHVTALLGPNGAGKTTFVSAVATLLRPDRGELRVAGIDATSEPQRVRQVVGLAGQFASVEPAMTGRENLELVGRLFGLNRRAARSAATALLDRIGLTDDVARAHAQRRHVGEATAALLDAERLAPEQVSAHHLAHDTITDLLAQSGRRPPTELLDLARRSGADQP